MPDKPTIEDCIAWLEDIRGDSMPEDILPLEATLACLRDYARMKAMLDDAHIEGQYVSRRWAPAHGGSQGADELITYLNVCAVQGLELVSQMVGPTGLPYTLVFKKVTAWDKERAE